MDNSFEDINISDQVAFFRFKEFEGGYLITNDFGNYQFLSSDEFTSFLQGELDEDSELYDDLRRKGFIKSLERLNDLNEQYTSRHANRYVGPNLHIVEVTLRCNQNCVYCQASSKSMDREDLDMDKDTAEEVVDMIFETTAPSFTIEFQGGEPMVNWDVVKFIIEYAREKEQKTDKEVGFSLVTNLTLMTEKKLGFLIDNRVGLSTSLDGPEELHNRNRPYADGNSYEDVVKWTKKYKKREKEAMAEGEPIYKMNALVTISRESLDYSKEIIDEYLKLDFHGIHLRALSYLGYSGGEAKNVIGYSAEEFLEFWKESLDYILEINKRGHNFYERGTRIRLQKMLTDEDPAFVDLMSPCGAVCGQLLYNHEGELYSCDEGRMLEEDIFKVGEVSKDSYEEIMRSDTTKSMLAASTLENQTCDRCAYKPYCGVCPVKNYAHHSTLFPQMESTDWCKVNKAQFNYIFSKLRQKETREIFEDWLQMPGS